MRRLSSIILALLVLSTAGCPRVAVRNATTYQIEIAAAEARQLEAADALHHAAASAIFRDDLGACRKYAAPMLLIEAAASHQAARALWLAHLPYPDPETGEVPPIGTEQPDPGPAPQPRPVSTVCGGAQ